MNTIGVKEAKVNMSLDEIIRREPLRYTLEAHSSTRGEDQDMSTKEWKRPRLYGRLNRGIKKNRSNYSNGHFRKGEPKRQQPQKKSPYDHTSFTYNGVHVGSDSTLLNRGTGILTILQTDAHKANGRVQKHMQKPKIMPLLEVPIIRYNDMTYVRKPVHERLGWVYQQQKQLLANQYRSAYKQRRQLLANQYRKTRVGLAAKFLRQRQRMESLGNKLRTSEASKNQYDLDCDVSQEEDPMYQQEGQVHISIVNDQTAKYIDDSQGQIITNSDGSQVYVAPLSRQNVAQLPGSRFRSSCSSIVTSASRTGVPHSRQDLEIQSLRDEFVTYNQELQKMQMQQMQQMQKVVQETVQQQLMTYMGGYMPMNPGMMAMGGMPAMMGGAMPYAQAMNMSSASSFVSENSRPTASNTRRVIDCQDGSVIMLPNLSPQAAQVNPVTNNPTFRRAASLQHLNGHMQTAMTDIQNNTGNAFDRNLDLPQARTTTRTINDRFSELC